ncbi:hypothetical protein [Stackebrandtia nassauensis]|uniref:hypothetical protein n=1 Tax=Stackebrandtia nassauensis TaxID=283811 RepID=UPI0001A391CB|nr:hypothetical protein [Stackebrandtia nassauensis]
MIAPAVLMMLGTVVVADTAAANNRAAPTITAYTNNIENLLTKKETCEGDWDELIYYIAENSTPDLFLLQQVSDMKQVNRFIEELEEHSDGNYSGLIADTEPNGGGRCGPEKARQLNAIVWNTDSLTYVKGTRAMWQSMRENPDSGGSQCVKNDQSRTVNVKANFKHRNGQVITAASIHWPTHASGNFKCADNSARELDDELKESPYKKAALQIVGGDMNYRDVNSSNDWSKWYKEMRANDFADPVRGLCGPTGGCNDGLWTHITDGVKRRIDYLFARRGTSNPAASFGASNVTFSSAQDAEERDHDESDSGCTTYPGRSGCFYSEHRAVTGRVF